jgi:hypothetical protein
VSPTRRMNWSATRVLMVACSALVLALLGAADGARGGKRLSEPPSIAVQQPDPHLGGTVTFTVTYPREVRYPRVAVRCFGADDSLIYAEAGAYDHAFLLGGAGSDWLRQGGAAHCTGELFYFSSKGSQAQEVRSLAWTDFDAAG